MKNHPFSRVVIYLVLPVLTVSHRQNLEVRGGRENARVRSRRCTLYCRVAIVYKNRKTKTHTEVCVFYIRYSLFIARTVETPVPTMFELPVLCLHTSKEASGRRKKVRGAGSSAYWSTAEMLLAIRNHIKEKHTKKVCFFP